MKTVFKWMKMQENHNNISGNPTRNTKSRQQKEETQQSDNNNNRGIRSQEQQHPDRKKETKIQQEKPGYNEDV